jgi:catalase (peroxidase I)
VECNAGRSDLWIEFGIARRGQVYASNDAGEKFVRDFAKAWTKVMNADRF